MQKVHLILIDKGYFQCANIETIRKAEKILNDAKMEHTTHLNIDIDLAETMKKRNMATL